MKVILSVPDEDYFERTWCRLFWAYLMKVILSVPDEGYFERTWWRLFWAYLMKVILSVPDEGYFECTWWRLFWAYLMMVILSVPDDGYFERTWWWLFQKTSCTLHLIYLPHEQHNRRLYNLNVMSRRFGIIFPFRGDCVGEYLIWSIDYFVYAFHALYIVYLIIVNVSSNRKKYIYIIVTWMHSFHLIFLWFMYQNVHNS